MLELETPYTSEQHEIICQLYIYLLSGFAKYSINIFRHTDYNMLDLILEIYCKLYIYLLIPFNSYLIKICHFQTKDYL